MDLYYTALSPFCRKVRMALDYKRLPYRLQPYSTDAAWGQLNRRAEIPILDDGGLVVVNSADILAYLDHRYPEHPLMPADPALRVKARRWERHADTWADAVVTNMAIWLWAHVGPRPDGLLDASRAEIGDLYTALEDDLAPGPFVCGEQVTVADLALLPHLSAAKKLDLGWSDERHPRLAVWFQALMQLPAAIADKQHARAWWTSRSPESVDADRINWGSYRLEMYLAMGFHERLFGDIQAGRVLWSVGPNRNWRTPPALGRPAA